MNDIPDVSVIDKSERLGGWENPIDFI